MTISEQVQNDFTNAAGVRKLNGTVVWDLLNDDTVGMFAWNSISYLFKKCIEIAILTAFSILPLLAVAAAGKNYILPVCVTLVYTFLSFILLMVNMYLHPLSSATAIIMRDIPGVILAQEVNIPAALFCIGIWTIVSIVFAYISLKHRK